MTGEGGARRWAGIPRWPLAEPPRPQVRGFVVAARSGILDRVRRGGRFVLIDSLSRGSSAFFCLLSPLVCFHTQELLPPRDFYAGDELWA